jgi:hypothetical protein
MDITRWARITGLEECSVLGVRRSDLMHYACTRVYSPYNRSMLQQALDRAQDRIEMELTKPLNLRAICDEEHPWGRNGIVGPTKFQHVRAFGTFVDDCFAPGETVTLGPEATPNDPVTLIVATTVTDDCEIFVRHTAANGGDIILPTSVTIAGGNATILIPRCRLVDPNVVQPETGYDYNVNANFVTEVDVCRRYADASEGAELVWFPNSLDDWCTDALACTETTQTACALLRRRRLGMVQVHPATFSNGTPTPTSLTVCSRVPDVVRLNYIANYFETCPLGCEGAPSALELAVVRYAHTLMQWAPCTCREHNLLWQDDRKRSSPPLMDEDNPLGWLNGAVFAWRTMQSYISPQGGAL